MTRTIDAHQHFWRLGHFDDAWLFDPARKVLCADHVPADLEPQIEAARVDATVAVQTQHDLAETLWLLELASQNDWIAGVVGWVDLCSPECGRQLDDLSQKSKFVGVRHITQDEADPDFIVREDVAAGLRELERRSIPFDLLFYAEHLRHAPQVAQSFPDLPLVIDHLSKPKIEAGDIEVWTRELREAARYPNVFCKLSGMVTEAGRNWSVATLAPYVRVALDAFGPERCMFGSDWPVCRLMANYGEVHAAAIELVSDLSPAERASVFGGTAVRFYGL